MHNGRAESILFIFYSSKKCNVSYERQWYHSVARYIEYWSLHLQLTWSGEGWKREFKDTLLW